MGESVVGDNSWEAEVYGGRGKNGWDGGPIQQNVHQVFLMNMFSTRFLIWQNTGSGEPNILKNWRIFDASKWRQTLRMKLASKRSKRSATRSIYLEIHKKPGSNLVMISSAGGEATYVRNWELAEKKNSGKKAKGTEPQPIFTRWWVVVSNIFFVIFTTIWGRWTHFDEHIFQMGCWLKPPTSLDKEFFNHFRLLFLSNHSSYQYNGFVFAFFFLSQKIASKHSKRKKQDVFFL